jgi:hypothetical protein
LPQGRDLVERADYHARVINKMRARTIDIARRLTKLEPAWVSSPSEH